jgi:hypothetical protein
MGIRVRGAAATFMVLAAAGAASAQQPAPGMTEEVQGWVAEMQQLQQQLAPVQEQALQEPALQEQQQRVASTLRNAMIANDPAMAQLIDRMEALLLEAREAQAAGDHERIVALTAEAEEIQPRFASAQAEAMEQPEVAAEIEAFQANVHARMRQIDPDTGPLLDRFLELDRRVTAALRGA